MLKLFGGRDVFQNHLVQANNYGDPCQRNSPAQRKKKRSIAGIALVKDKTYSYPSSPVSAVVESCVPSPKNRRLEWTLTASSETADSCGSSDSLDMLPLSQRALSHSRPSSSTADSGATKLESTRLNLAETVSLFHTFNVGMRKDLMELFFEWSVAIPSRVLQQLKDCDSGAAYTLESINAVRDMPAVMERAVTVANLMQFMETQQLETCTLDDARAIVERFEKDAHLRSHHLLSYEGFASFMGNASNFAFLSENLLPREEDMHHPLSHYYIASSHNTYLTGHQLKGIQSISTQLIYSYIYLLR